MGKQRLEAFTDGVIAIIITIMVLDMKVPDAYIFLQQSIIAFNGKSSKLAQAIGDDLKGRLSLSGYVLAIPLAFVRPWISLALYVAIALLWFIPDRRIESII